MHGNDINGPNLPNSGRTLIGKIRQERGGVKCRRCRHPIETVGIGTRTLHAWLS
ncbi:zinc finger domain-containing protein [Desulfosarcina widdelii]|uniref:zinc finger domain-containing protein n=1 Tax=Desulfosarcina widdelii TaxID=947919 RepID=UPI00338EF763